MPKKWMTKTGAALLAVGYAVTQLPPDFVVGTLHGGAITAGYFAQVFGIFLTVTGLGRKLDRIEK